MKSKVSNWFTFYLVLLIAIGKVSSITQPLLLLPSIESSGSQSNNPWIHKYPPFPLQEVNGANEVSNTDKREDSEALHTAKRRSIIPKNKIQRSNIVETENEAAGKPSISLLSVNVNSETRGNAKKSKEEQLLIKPKGLHGLQQRLMLFTQGQDDEEPHFLGQFSPRKDPENGAEKRKAQKLLLSRDNLAENETPISSLLSATATIQVTDEDNRKNSANRIESRFYSPEADQVFVSQLPPRTYSSRGKFYNLPPKKYLPGLFLSSPNRFLLKNAEIKKPQTKNYNYKSKIKYLPKIPSKPDHAFRYIGVIHPKKSRVKKSKITPPPKLEASFFQSNYVYGQKDENDPQLSIPLTEPTFVDIPVQASNLWPKPDVPKPPKPIVILSLPKLPPPITTEEGKKSKRPVETNIFQFEKPIKKVILRPSKANVFISDFDNEIDVTLGSRLRTKPEYDDFGYWVPSKNPWELIEADHIVKS